MKPLLPDLAATRPVLPIQRRFGDSGDKTCTYHTCKCVDTLYIYIYIIDVTQLHMYIYIYISDNENICIYIYNTHVSVYRSVYLYPSNPSIYIYENYMNIVSTSDFIICVSGCGYCYGSKW